MNDPNNLIFFESPVAFRRWLEENHLTENELWVGFHKRATGRPSLTWPESVDQALCFGWIDGIRKSIDGEAYKIRFTPRNPKSNWSGVNIRRMNELIGKGLVMPVGLAVFEKRDERNSARASYEQRAVGLSPEFEAEFRKQVKAWAFFCSQAPSYRKTVMWWVMSAKQEATRQKRLQVLIADSEAGQKIALLRRGK